MSFDKLELHEVELMEKVQLLEINAQLRAALADAQINIRAIEAAVGCATHKAAVDDEKLVTDEVIRDISCLIKQRNELQAGVADALRVLDDIHELTGNRYAAECAQRIRPLVEKL